MKKTTEELIKSLESKKSVDEYFEDNKEELFFGSLVDLINFYMNQKSLNKSDVIERSGIQRNYGYQLISGVKKPSRDKLIMLCIGLGLNYRETQQMLKKSGFGILYVRDVRDSIIIFCINHKMNIMAVNNLLYDKGQKILE